MSKSEQNKANPTGAVDVVHRGSGVVPHINVDPKRIENSGDYGWSIVVADRGFVWIGDCLREGDSVFMANAQNIRQWGTTKGLGELASHGPTRETELDPIDCLIIPMRAVIAIIPSDTAKWVMVDGGYARRG